jgi:hypothetical protein
MRAFFSLLTSAPNCAQLTAAEIPQTMPDDARYGGRYNIGNSDNLRCVPGSSGSSGSQSTVARSFFPDLF